MLSLIILISSVYQVLYCCTISNFFFCITSVIPMLSHISFSIRQLVTGMFSNHCFLRRRLRTLVVTARGTKGKARSETLGRNNQEKLDSSNSARVALSLNTWQSGWQTNAELKLDMPMRLLPMCLLPMRLKKDT